MTKQDKLSIPYQVKSNLASYKEIDEAQRTVKAVVNTYNYYDYDKDVLRVGSAKRSIDMRGSKSDANDKILHALFHDLKQLPGKSINEAETEVSGNFVLYAESKLSETVDGENTLVKYQDGIYNQHSIGFSYVQIEYIENEGSGWDDFTKNLINPEEAEKFGYGWDVKEINWFEWSTVALGANKLTPYLGVKTKNKNIQLANIYKKMDALMEKAKRFEVKNKKIFELQLKQLKQMVLELTQIDSVDKDALVKPSKPATHSVDYNYLITNL